MAFFFVLNRLLIQNIWVTGAHATRLAKLLLVAVVLFTSVVRGWGQQADTLRIMQYNLTNYGNNAFGCTNATNGLAKKDSLIRIIVGFAQPDIIGFNEVKSISTFAQRILQLNLNINGVTSWATAASNFTAGSDLMNAFFYNTTKVGLKAQFKINTPVRLLDHYKMYVQPQPGQADTTFFNVIVAHLKAGNTAADRTSREAQVAILNQYLATQDTSEGFIFQGDMNVYGSAEVNYQKMLNPAQGGFFKDPVNRQGSWTNNGAFADVHTQCPSTATGGCFSGGGLDDRFDQQLSTSGLLSGIGRLQYLGSAFRVLGNDGKHFNQNITDGTNTSAPPAVLGALINNSDHLPILGKLLVSTPLAAKAHFPTLHRAWAKADGLYFGGVEGPYQVKAYTADGRLVSEPALGAQENLLPLRGIGSKQWLVVQILPRQSGSQPSVHRVWYDAQ